MEYKDVRSKIRSGDILAFSDSGWDTIKHITSQVIRFFTRSEYNHTATAWVVGGRVFVIEAIMPLVRIYPLSKKGDFFWIPVNSKWTDETETFALAQVGVHYSIWDALISMFRTPSTTNGWQCTELTKAIAKQDGLALESLPTPSNMVKELQEKGFQATFVDN